jgi:hypothetical protein
MKQIQLSNGGTVLIDDEDFVYISRFHWYSYKHGYTYYALRKKRPGKGSSNVQMHREIMKNPECFEIDHKDGNGLNNQKSNLRICNRSENLQNSRKRKDNTSGYKGVWFQKTIKKYVAQITNNKKIIYIGVFKTAIDAAIAYDFEAKRLFGCFAKTNF